MLKGGASNDVLIDDAGADKFVFNTTLGAANIDSSSDYSVADDTIYLENGGAMLFLSRDCSPRARL